MNAFCFRNPRVLLECRSHRWPVPAILMLLAGCQPAVMDPQGPVGIAERTILLDSLAIMLAIVAPTIAATLAFAWWFRASNQRARYLPYWAYSGRVELVTWGIPLLTVMLLGGVTWVASHNLDPAKPLTSKSPTLQVEVVSLDWKWLFIYPDQRVASVNQLMLPVGIPVSLSLTSASVMNTFFVPQLGSMIYTMNGMSSKLNLMADRPGAFRGLSAHFSGDGFSDMHFEVHAMPTDQFEGWIKATRKQGPKLNEASYGSLEKPSTNVAPFTYGDADPAIYNRIVTRQIAPAPGPLPVAGPSVVNLTRDGK